MPAIKLVIGLGNPGALYANTRHNAGAWYVQRLAKHYQITLKTVTRFKAQIAQHFQGNHPLTLLIPNTFMNLSGSVVAEFAHFHQLLPEEILVAHDELDLPVGTIRFKQGGGHAGHNGLRNIIQQLANCRDFHRLRIGIGHPGRKDQVVNFVLGNPSSAERQMLEQAIEQTIENTDTLLKNGNSTIIS